MTTTSLRHVPVLMTGTWNASTGTEPVTDEDLLAIVAAAESGMLDPAILKKGHNDPRFNSYLEDGEPAFGQVKNPVIEDGILYVDYDPIDSSLAESLEVSYPRCSVELARNVELRDAEGETIAQFDVALTAVALLGATPPAVKGLSVHASELRPDQREYRTMLPVGQFSAVRQFSFPGGNTARSLQEKLSAAVQAAHSGEYTWAYLEDFDDEVAIFTVMSGDGDEVSYRQAYSAEGGSPSLIGDPTQVVREVKWVSESQVAASAPAAPTTGDTPRHGANLPPRPPETTHAMSDAAALSGSTQSASEGEEAMPTVDKDTAAELRRKYDLAENAGYEDILAKVLEDKPEAPAAPAKNVAPGSDELPRKEAEAQREAEDAKRIEPYLSEKPGTPAPVELDEKALAEKLGGQFVSASAFAAFQAEHEQVKSALAAREAAETKARRDELVRGWFRTGRVGPDDAALVREQLDAPGAEDTIAKIINARPQLFSGERGHGNLTPDFLVADTESTLSAKQFEADDNFFSPTNK